jgi:hypothetical protein
MGVCILVQSCIAGHNPFHLFLRCNSQWAFDCIVYLL